MTLSGDRVCLRRWHDEDREAFASMNADVRVMQFFRGPLSRVQSDAMIDHIEKHFSDDIADLHSSWHYDLVKNRPISSSIFSSSMTHPQRA